MHKKIHFTKAERMSMKEKRRKEIVVNKSILKMYLSEEEEDNCRSQIQQQ